MEEFYGCDCPFCGNEAWDCEHLVLDIGGGGEDGGIGGRASGGLRTRMEMFEALLVLVTFAWGNTQSPPRGAAAVWARLHALSQLLPFGAEGWWCDYLLDGLVGSIAPDRLDRLGANDDGDSLAEYLSRQLSDEDDAESGSLLEQMWLDVMRGLLKGVPGIKVGDCEVDSMTAGLFDIVWSADRGRAETDIASAVSSMAAQIQEAIAAASGSGTHDA